MLIACPLALPVTTASLFVQFRNVEDEELMDVEDCSRESAPDHGAQMCPKLLRKVPSRQTSPKMSLLFQLNLVNLNILRYLLDILIVIRPFDKC